VECLWMEGGSRGGSGVYVDVYTITSPFMNASLWALLEGDLGPEAGVLIRSTGWVLTYLHVSGGYSRAIQVHERGYIYIHTSNHMCSVKVCQYWGQIPRRSMQ